METNKVYFIEGADNVGKTTLINNLKKSHINKVKYTKFPIDNEDFVFNFTLYQNAIENCRNKILDILSNQVLVNNESYYINLYNKYILKLSLIMLKQMSGIFIKDVFKLNDYIISDRGPLSTYLYQYRNIDSVVYTHNSPNFELDQFIDFFKLVKEEINIPFQYNFIVLCNNYCGNNPSRKLMNNDTNLDYNGYKNELDMNIYIQNNINNSINLLRKGLMKSCDDIDVNEMIFQFVNIFDENDSTIRKSEEQILKEVEDIIFNK